MRALAFFLATVALSFTGCSSTNEAPEASAPSSSPEASEPEGKLVKAEGFSLRLDEEWSKVKGVNEPIMLAYSTPEGESFNVIRTESEFDGDSEKNFQKVKDQLEQVGALNVKLDEELSVDGEDAIVISASLKEPSNLHMVQALVERGPNVYFLTFGGYSLEDARAQADLALTSWSWD